MSLFSSFCKRRTRDLVVLGLALACFSLHAFGQEATLVGTVTDQSGAVVANAKVTATNSETGVMRHDNQ